MAKTTWGTDIPADWTLTDDIYWKSVRPELRVLRNYRSAHPESSALIKGRELAALGLPVDVTVMCFGVPILTQMTVMSQILGWGARYAIENGTQLISVKAEDFPPYPEAPADPTDWVSASNVEGFEGTPYYEPTEAGRPIPIGFVIPREDGAPWIKLGPGAIPGGPETAYGFWMRIG